MMELARVLNWKPQILRI